MDTPSDSETVAARHYVLLGFLTLLNVMNFVDRQLLASFANFIVPDLGLTNFQFGLLTGLAFIVFYAFMGVLMGALADLVHRPRLISAGLFLWSALTAASGAARGFVSLMIPRMFIGIGESALTPASLSLLADRFPASRLGFATAIYYMGVPVGVGASLLVAGYKGPAIGWRNCFYVLGAVGVVFSIIMLSVRETRPMRVGAFERPKLGDVVGTSLLALRRSPALAYTIAAGVVFHFVLGAAAFDQLWYARELGFERAKIAQLTGWIGMTGGILGNVVGGLGGDWWQRNTRHGRPMFLVVLGVLLAPVGILYRLSDGPSPMFWIGVFVGFFQLGTFYGPAFATVQELSPAKSRGTVVAFFILMINLVGLGFGITGGGWLVDYLIRQGSPTPYGTTLLLFTFISMLSIPLLYLAGRRFYQDRDALRQLV